MFSPPPEGRGFTPSANITAPNAHQRRGKHLQATAPVRNATKLLWVLVGIGVLRTILTFALFDSLLDAYVDQRGDTGLSREVVEDEAPAYRSVALVTGLLFAALLTAAALGVSQGRHWARTLGIVLSVLVGFGGLISAIQPAPIVFPLLGVVSAAVAIATVVFLARPEVRTWCKRRR